ncbi:hypothetical protein PHLCEN_2v5198 [Hermanssonia centrifuga]|uniref:Alpha-type protein kinase domain-containing protein n=1 Tax=Hermanssonia centrifuga TaxID=98765 RepID=A0A2R6P8Z8_9APHY|nr:hypothetical protein PHLCEN_2v5198 [Hermanssonia centrifuga]
MLPNGQGAGQILFDIMMHTPDGKSGVGDHGQEGIDIFLEQHQCQQFCHELQLGPLRIPRLNHTHAARLKSVEPAASVDDENNEEEDKEDALEPDELPGFN